MCYPIPTRELWEQNVEKAPLGQRGLVMQERVLSPRIIHFAADRAYWECRTSIVGGFITGSMQCLGQLNGSNLDGRTISNEQDQSRLFTYSPIEFLYEWQLVVEKYTERYLT